MDKYDDLAVKDGVQLARDYVNFKQENARLNEDNELKNTFLKRLKDKQN